MGGGGGGRRTRKADSGGGRGSLSLERIGDSQSSVGGCKSRDFYYCIDTATPPVKKGESQHWHLEIKASTFLAVLFIRCLLTFCLCAQTDKEMWGKKKRKKLISRKWEKERILTKEGGGQILPPPLLSHKKERRERDEESGREVYFRRQKKSFSFILWKELHFLKEGGEKRTGDEVGLWKKRKKSFYWSSPFFPPADSWFRGGLSDGGREGKVLSMNRKEGHIVVRKYFWRKKEGGRGTLWGVS